MYELKKIGKVFTSEFVGTGPSSYEKRTYRAAISQRLRNSAVEQSKFDSVRAVEAHGESSNIASCSHS